MVKFALRSVMLAGLFFVQSAWATSIVEFMQLKGAQQYELTTPIMLGFLKAGYKKVPDNEFTFIGEIKKLAYEKGYVYQNLEDVAKEAAIRMGMTRGY